MTEYGTVDEMWAACVQSLRAMPLVESRDGPCREMLGYSATLSDPSYCLLRDTVRDLDPYYAAAECMWYLSGTDRTEFIEQYAPQYARMVDDHVAYGAYGKRLFADQHEITGSAVEWAIKGLKESCGSRQIVLDLHEPRDLRLAVWRKQRDIPCTLSVQLLLRRDELHMIVTMRSNDVWLGMPYDVFWWCTLLKILSCELGCGIGKYHHRAGSMHLYERNVEKAYGVGDPRLTLRSWWRASDTFQHAREHAMWLVHDQLKAYDTGDIGRQLYEVSLAKLERRPVRIERVTDNALQDAIKRRQA